MSRHAPFLVIQAWRSSVAIITDVPALPSFHKSNFSAWASCILSSFAKCRALSAVASKVRKCSRRSKREMLPEVSTPWSESKANAMLIFILGLFMTLPRAEFTTHDSG